jgi:rRNA maturation protein Nop10
MERSKQIVIGAVLIVVAIIAVVITVKRTTGGVQPPSWVLDQQVEKMDIKSMEVLKASLRDWMGKYAPDASGYWKNPKTGQYTMANVITCSSCGARIPGVQMPKGATPEAAEKLQGEYKCPKCGKNAYQLQLRPRP